jgi:enamine deaminase RidA (YjgF/YER057c/UK114 family)
VERRLIPGHSPYEARFGFSRAIRVGDLVLVSGTAPIPSGGGDPPAGAYEQAQLCLSIVLDALAQAGGRPEHVVRTRMFLARAEVWEDVARAHGDVFGEVRPAATAVIASLLDPRWLVEIEADALIA